VHNELRNKARKLLDRGAEGLVLDLRANGGGLLGEAVLVSSVFVPSGAIVSTRGRARPRRVFEATGDAIRKTPLVVLVDHGTASSSEIVTAALRDRLGAKVVGLRTFGKGVFQQLFTLPNGGGVALIVGSYFTPDGHNLRSRGIKPDIRAADDPDTRRDEALDRTLRVLAGETRRSAARG
jgi:carboxyl-terminal processing protease